MSRIEKALELASQLRSGASPAPHSPPAQEHPPAVGAQRRTPPRTVGIDRENRLLVTLTEPNSAIAEQFRKLKGSLIRLTAGETFRNLIMVTSALVGEGKSFTAANLALSLAQEFDHTVLLVDADLRRPSIHRYLGFEQSLGLTDCLLEGRDLGEAIVRTDVPKLSVITAGREVEKPLELFASKKMQELMGELKSRYTDRYVVLDTPPLLPFAETRTLSHLVDGIVFVVHEGVTPQQSVLEAREVLKGCPVLGVVLNDSTSLGKDDSHYSYYYRQGAR